MKSSGKARIKVDPRRVVGTVDPGIYGGFIEHLGRCIYGGIFDEGSALSDERGFRRDVMDAIRELGITHLRWPGGLFASGYHWVDGIGPRDARPRRLDLAWRAEESNRFGTDDFVEYCRTVGTEPVLCINMGTGTIDEAAAWVEYCNGRGDTYWARRRREHGIAEQYGIRFWCLGNEVYNRQAIGTLTAEEYVRKAVEMAKAMKMVDPAIQLISSGLNGWSRWDRVVLEGLAPYVNLHSIHLYTGSPEYFSNVLAPHLAERALRACAGVIEGVRYQQGIKHPIHVAYDEWNVWYRAGSPPWEQWAQSDGGLEEQYDLADALAVATYLNVFVRHCNTVRMANIAQLVNVLAPIMTRGDELVRQTIFYPFLLFSRHMRGEALDTYVECDVHVLRPEDETSPWPHRVHDLGPFNLLDVTAVRGASGLVNVAVINRDPERAIEAALDVEGMSACSAHGMTGPDARVEQRDLNGRATHVFPSRSLTILGFRETSA